MSTVSSVAAPAIFSSPPEILITFGSTADLPDDIVARKRAQSEQKLWPVPAGPTVCRVDRTASPASVITWYTKAAGVYEMKCVSPL